MIIFLTPNTCLWWCEGGKKTSILKERFPDLHRDLTQSLCSTLLSSILFNIVIVIIFFNYPNMIPWGKMHDRKQTWLFTKEKNPKCNPIIKDHQFLTPDPHKITNCHKIQINIIQDNTNCKCTSNFLKTLVLFSDNN